MVVVVVFVDQNRQKLCVDSHDLDHAADRRILKYAKIAQIDLGQSGDLLVSSKKFSSLF